MARCFRRLRAEAMVPDSVVRKCLTLSKQRHVLEEVGPPDDLSNWRAIVWLDNSRDLSRSVQGPWSLARGPSGYLPRRRLPCLCSLT